MLPPVFIVVCFLAGFSSAKIEVCYGKYGCFSNAEPFNHRIVLLPLPPLVVSPKFHLYTRSNMKEPQTINDHELTKLQQSHYNGAKRTVLVVHGYIEFRPTWMTRIKDGLLNKVDCNVILAHWSKGSLPPYVQASGNTRLVGSMIAELIKFLISRTQGSVDLFHVVGFSLGAQIAGYTGRRLGEAGLTLGRITGLDPAGPLFSSTHSAVRLDPSDARFVDVIHTDARRWGIEEPCGHIDFYPNGGENQLGCLDITTGLGPLNPIVCDHFRATDYFVDSLAPKCVHVMRGFPCSDADEFDRGRCLSCNGACPVMGYDAVQNDDNQIHGRHYLYTTRSAPFCVPYYTVITFETSWSWLVGLLKAHIVVKLYGDAGESHPVELRSRNLKAGSTEKFLMPGFSNIGKLQKIQVRQTFNSWILKWKLNKVLVNPGWTGTQSDRSISQLFTACFKTYVGRKGVIADLLFGDIPC